MTETESFDIFEEKLKTLAGPGICPGLSRISNFLSFVDNPERKFNVVHVVGTNGKGSTAATLSSILIDSGYKVATYTSPHLVSFGERLSINNKNVSVSKWMKTLRKIEKIMKLNKCLIQNPPTYFELITVLAFMMIAEEKVDIAVVEAGLGGRLDATNILKNIRLTLIASIGIDHTEYLGDSLRDIAAEKFAVIRKNTPTIFQGGNDVINQQFLETVRKSFSIGNILDKFCEYNSLRVNEHGTDFYVTYNGTKSDYHTPLIGTHQTKNATLAIMGAEALKKGFPSIDQSSMQSGVANTIFQGRFEVVSKSPMLILDGAHNPHATHSLVETLKQLFKESHIKIVLAMMQDKDVKKSLSILSKLDCSIFCTEIPEMARSMKSDKLLQIAKEVGIKSLSTYKNPIDAVLSSLSHSEITICCGSLYLIGYIKKNLKLLENKIDSI